MSFSGWWILGGVTNIVPEIGYLLHTYIYNWLGICKLYKDSIYWYVILITISLYLFAYENRKLMENKFFNKGFYGDVSSDVQINNLYR